MLYFDYITTFIYCNNYMHNMNNNIEFNYNNEFKKFLSNRDILMTERKKTNKTTEEIRESKHNNFKRLAEKRVQNVLKYLGLLENLSNRHNYYYEDFEIKKIFNTIEDEIKRIKPLFKKPKVKNFKLD